MASENHRYPTVALSPRSSNSNPTTKIPSSRESIRNNELAILPREPSERIIVSDAPLLLPFVQNSAPQSLVNGKMCSWNVGTKLSFPLVYPAVATIFHSCELKVSPFKLLSRAVLSFTSLGILRCMGARRNSEFLIFGYQIPLSEYLTRYLKELGLCTSYRYLGFTDPFLRIRASMTSEDRPLLLKILQAYYPFVPSTVKRPILF